MDYSSQYQQGASSSQDPSSQAQIQQSYDQSSYYSYQQQDYSNNQQHYSYYPLDYYQQQQQQYQPEPVSIHPPGVPIPPPSSDHYAAAAPPSDPYAAAAQQYSYYPQYSTMPTGSHTPAAQGIGYSEIGASTMPAVSQTPVIVVAGRGKRGSRSYRGGGRGNLSGGRLQSVNAVQTSAQDQTNLNQGAQVQGVPSQVKPSSSASTRPPRAAWCELCKIECNTAEVLEQHKNGKKHKKNLAKSEGVQKLNKLMDGGHPDKAPNTEYMPGVSSQPGVEQSGQIQIQQDGNMAGKQKVEEAAPTEELEKDSGIDNVQGQGRGIKRSVRGGRGGKYMKSSNGSRKPAVPPNPKKMVPLICELCNVTCESVVVFQSHLAGKKHLSNLKDFQSQQELVGQAALQALYPALQALYPALQALYQSNAGASTSGTPQSPQPNLQELLGLLTQQALTALPQNQVLGMGTGATPGLPPPSDLLAQDHQGPVSEETKEIAAAGDGKNLDLTGLQNTGVKPGENTDDKQLESNVTSTEDPLVFAACGDAPSTSGTVMEAASVSNTEAVSSDCTAPSGLDGKLVD